MPSFEDLRNGIKFTCAILAIAIGFSLLLYAFTNMVSISTQQLVKFNTSPIRVDPVNGACYQNTKKELPCIGVSAPVQ